MKIVVGIKHVPDTEAKIKIGGDGVSIDENGVKWVISPFDDYALEEALRIREAQGGEVVLVSVGREGSKTTLRQGLAMGADRAVLVEDARYDRADTLDRVRAIAAVARAEAADLVLLGKYGVGTDEALTGPMLAAMMDWPHASAITSLNLSEGSFSITRQTEAGIEHQEGQTPAVLSCEKGLNEPRYPSLKGIMQAKKKPIDLKKPEELELDTQPLDSPRLSWEALELPPARQDGRIVDGAPEEAARELVRLLREEAKVI
jgi:electron transfer flavoprotein beta subunit